MRKILERRGEATPTATKVFPYEVELEQYSPGIRITVHA